MKEREHRCAEIPTGGISVLSADAYIHGTGWEWCLVVERQATERDLEDNPLLEEVGETIWYTAVGITHCPFCGQRLAEAKASIQTAPAEFVHADGSGWDIEIQ